MQNKDSQLKFFKFTSLILLAILVIAGVVFIFSSRNKPSTNSKTSSLNLAEKAKPVAEAQIGKSFGVPIAKGSKESLKIILDKAVLVNLVTAKGKPLVPKAGESFLLVYLEIENNTQSTYTVSSQNYFRLVDENGKKFAPDFYNTSIQVAPISTKKDQIGFVVKENKKDFKLQIIEPNTEQEIIEIKL